MSSTDTVQMPQRAIDERLHGNGRCDTGRRARLNRVSQQVAERLPQQHVVAFDGGKLPVDDDVAGQCPRIGAQIIGRALRDGAEIDRRQGELSRLREVQEVGHDLAHRLGFGANAFDVRPELGRQRFEIQQPAVPVNRGQPVAKLVRDAGRQFTDAREAVFQPHLLLERDHRGQIGEEANHAVRRRRVVSERRHAEPKVQRRRSGGGNFDGAADQRPARARGIAR